MRRGRALAAIAPAVLRANQGRNRKTHHHREGRSPDGEALRCADMNMTRGVKPEANPENQCDRRTLPQGRNRHGRSGLGKGNQPAARRLPAPRVLHRP